MSNMTAEEYLKTKARMTSKCINMNCDFCPLYGQSDSKEMICFKYETQHPNEAIERVEQWSKEHPVKTRQSEFLKMFPNAVCSNGIIDICPNNIDKTFVCEHVKCKDCVKKFWNEEIE